MILGRCSDNRVVELISVIYGNINKNCLLNCTCDDISMPIASCNQIGGYISHANCVYISNIEIFCIDFSLFHRVSRMQSKGNEQRYQWTFQFNSSNKLEFDASSFYVICMILELSPIHTRAFFVHRSNNRLKVVKINLDKKCFRI